MGSKNKHYPLPEGRKWLSIALEQPRPSLNPNMPPAVITALLADRSDGVSFRVEGQLHVDKIKLLPSPVDGALVGLQLVKDLFVQLETYRNCECVMGKPCNAHGGGSPS